MKEKIKEYNLISDDDSKDMYMIIDALDIYYKEYIKNSMSAINIVLHFFEKFSNENNIQCGDLFISSMEYDGEICYYGVCDGLSNNYNELVEMYGTDYATEFLEYCEKNELDLDYINE